jgi:hypothetical protein
MTMPSLTGKDDAGATVARTPRYTIPLGAKSLDGFILPDGSFRLSQGYVAEYVGKHQNDTQRFLQKHFPGEILDTIKVSRARGASKVCAVPLCRAVEYWQYQARTGNVQAFDLLTQISQNPHPELEAFRDLCVVKPLKRRKKKEQDCEKWYAKRLKSQIGGRAEVLTPAGLIDLLTPTQVIELKLAKNWKEAIGQILVYSAYYPSHEKRIHLFGECHSSMLDTIQGHCQRLNILLTWETR